MSARALRNSGIRMRKTSGSLWLCAPTRTGHAKPLSVSCRKKISACFIGSIKTWLCAVGRYRKKLIVARGARGVAATESRSVLLLFAVPQHKPWRYNAGRVAVPMCHGHYRPISSKYMFLNDNLYRIARRHLRDSASLCVIRRVHAGGKVRRNTNEANEANEAERLTNRVSGEPGGR